MRITRQNKCVQVQDRWDLKTKDKKGWLICMVDMPSSEFTTKMEMNLAQPEPLAECRKGSTTKGHVWVRAGLEQQTLWPVCYTFMHVLSSGQTESLCLSCLGCFPALHVKVKEVKDLWNLWTLRSCPTHDSCLGKVACTCYPDNVWGPLTCPLFRDKGANSWDSLWAFWLAALKVLALSMEGNNLQALSMLGHVNQN